MSKTNYGGPAFPATEEHGLNTSHFGMTLRDYFAAKAMQSIVSRAPVNKEMQVVVAERAYGIADAMLEARDHAS